MDIETSISLNLFEQYFKRFLVEEPYLNDPPKTNVHQIVVIPCYDEPDLLKSLQSLHRCTATEFGVEVIVVLNQSENEGTLENNEFVLKQFDQWKSNLEREHLSFHLMKIFHLPHKHAGVGLARKRGMDEAVHRFNMLDRPDGLITCFDADATCSVNYLRELERSFLITDRNSVGGSIYFEHSIKEAQNQHHARAIYDYELFLRYYVEALRFTEHPSSFHTIGSSMLVRCNAYMRLGGMNRRKAGEDFYFLQKLIPHGDYKNIISCTVYPSARVSHRVPFGTGKAINDYLNEGKKPEGYNPQIFKELKAFHLNQIQYYQKRREESVFEGLSCALINFLVDQNWSEESLRMLKLSKTPDQYLKQFYSWWDGFKVLKAVHFMRDSGYPSKNIEQVALGFAGDFLNFKGDRDILTYYRNLEKEKAR